MDCSSVEISQRNKPKTVTMFADFASEATLQVPTMRNRPKNTVAMFKDFASEATLHGLNKVTCESGSNVQR